MAKNSTRTANQHGHDHGGHNHVAPAGFGRAFAIGTALNLGFVIFEATYGITSGSMATLPMPDTTSATSSACSSRGEPQHSRSEVPAAGTPTACVVHQSLLP